MVRKLSRSLTESRSVFQKIQNRAELIPQFIERQPIGELGDESVGADHVPGSVNAHPPARGSPEDRIDRNTVNQRIRTGEVESRPGARIGEVEEVGGDCVHGGLPFQLLSSWERYSVDLGLYAGRVRKGLIRKGSRRFARTQTPSRGVRTRWPVSPRRHPGGTPANGGVFQCIPGSRQCAFTPHKSPSDLGLPAGAGGVGAGQRGGVSANRKRKDGRTEWIPPPHLDTGQARVNNYHHPERYLIPDDDERPDENDEETGDPV